MRLNETKRVLKDHIKISRYVKNPAAFYKHCEEVSKIGIKTVKTIQSAYGKDVFPVDLETIGTGGILHDIGYTICEPNYQHDHGPVGAAYLDALGYPKLAKIVRSHSFAKECLEETKKRKLGDVRIIEKMLYNMNPDDVEQKTWEEVIVTYADMGKNFDERIKGLKRRYKEDKAFMRALKAGESRIREMYDDVENLKAGRYTKEQISKYGFI